MRFFVLIFLVQVVFFVNAQVASEIYAGFDLKNKYEYHKVLLPSKYIVNRIDDTNGLFSTPNTHLFLGTMFKDKYGIELGYFNELFQAGIYTVTPDGILCGESRSIDLIDNYYIKVNYRLFKYKKISIFPELSFIYGDAKYWNTTPISISGPGCKDLYIKVYDKKGVDWGLHKYYLFLNGGIKIDYSFNRKYSITASMGYNQGFKTMGYSRGYYIYKGEARQYFKNRTKGTNYYFTIGFKYHYKVNPKKESFLVEKGNRKYLWDDNFHFYGGIVSSLDIADDNISIRYMPKFGVSLEIRKNRLSISSSLFYLNRSINYTDYPYPASSYDIMHNTSSVLNIYVDFRGIEINQALNYYYYLSDKLNLYAGVGYFRMNLKLERDQYEIKHSDKYAKIFIDYLSYNKTGWLLNVGGAYKINESIRLNASLDIKNMKIYRKIARISDKKKRPVLSFNLKIDYDF